MLVSLLNLGIFFLLHPAVAVLAVELAAGCLTGCAQRWAYGRKDQGCSLGLIYL